MHVQSFKELLLQLYRNNIDPYHFNDVIKSAIACQITSLTIVHSTVNSGADQRKHQSSVSLVFVWIIHRWSVNSPHKWPVTRKMFPFDDVIITCGAIEAYPSGQRERNCLCEGYPPVTNGFPSQKPVTQSFDVFFDLRLSKRLNEQSRRWWFETPSRSLWWQVAIRWSITAVDQNENSLPHRWKHVYQIHPVVSVEYDIIRAYTCDTNFSTIVTSAERWRLYFHLCWFVCLFVC